MLVGSTIVTFLSAAMMASAAPAADAEANIEERSYGYSQPAHISCASGYGWYGNSCCRNDCWYNNRCNPVPNCHSGYKYYGNTCCIESHCWGNSCQNRPQCQTGYGWYTAINSCCKSDCWYNNMCNKFPRGYYGKD